MIYVYQDKDLTFTITSVIIDYIKTDTDIDVINNTNTLLDAITHNKIKP